MNKEGQTAEQPVAPAPAATPEAVSGTAPTAVSKLNTPPVNQLTTDAASSATINNSSQQENIARGKNPQNRKKLSVIICSAMIAILVIAGLIALAANLSSKSPSKGSNDTTVTSDSNTTATATEIETEAERLAESDINGMVNYIDEIISAYNSGTGYQDLSKEDVGNLATKGTEQIYQYMGDNPDQREGFGTHLLEYAHTADDLLQTADSAVGAYFAEYYYGSKEAAEQYKQTAIARGSHGFDTNADGEG